MRPTWHLAKMVYAPDGANYNSANEESFINPPTCSLRALDAYLTRWDGAGWRQAHMQYIFFLITMSAEVEVCYKQSSLQSEAIAPTLSFIEAHSKTENILIIWRMSVLKVICYFQSKFLNYLQTSIGQAFKSAGYLSFASLSSSHPIV